MRKARSGRRFRRRFGMAGLAVAAVSVLLPATTAVPAGAAPVEAAAPARVQIRIITGDVSDAGTDDPVFVSLRSNNKTWLDAPGDDWERGSSRTYDLVLDNVTNIASITQLRIGKAAPLSTAGYTFNTNAWCLERVILLLDGVPIVNVVPTPVSPMDKCRWLKGEAPWFTWTSAELRANKYWATAAIPPSHPIIKNEELSSRMLARVAQRIHADPRLRWSANPANPGVTVKAVDPTTVHVDLDLYARIFGPDSEVDIDFDLRFACEGSRWDPLTGLMTSPRWTVTPRNMTVNVDSSWIYDLALGLGTGLDIAIWGEIIGSLNVASESILVPGGSGCPPPKVNRYGDVNLVGGGGW